MKRLAIYLAVTFGLTWTMDFCAGFAFDTFAQGIDSSAPMIGLVALSMFFPLAGALVANYACPPHERIDLCLRPLIKGNARYYLAAWLVPACITLLGCVVFYTPNPQFFDATGTAFISSLGEAGPAIDQDLLAPMIAAAVVSSLLVAPFINMIPAFGEEVGWRGMLFPTLAELSSERSAALASGIIWGLWHAPIIAMGHNFGMDYPGFPALGIVTMVITCTAMACCLSYLRVRSGSVWPCALAHGAFNACANIGMFFCTVGQNVLGPSPLGLVAGIPLIVLGLICWLRLAR